MLDLIVVEFLPHLFVSLKDVEVLSPHALEARDDTRNLDVHEQVDELEARQQVFETKAAQDLVHALGQERVEAHVHFFFTGKLAVDLATPHQVNYCQCNHARVERLDLVAQCNGIQDRDRLIEVALSRFALLLEVELSFGELECGHSLAEAVEVFHKQIEIVEGGGHLEFIVHAGEYFAFHHPDLLLCVTAVSGIGVVGGARRLNLFVLGSDVETGNSDELEVLLLDLGIIVEVPVG